MENSSLIEDSNQSEVKTEDEEMITPGTRQKREAKKTWKIDSNSSKKGVDQKNKEQNDIEMEIPNEKEEYLANSQIEIDDETIDDSDSETSFNVAIIPVNGNHQKSKSDDLENHSKNKSLEVDLKTELEVQEMIDNGPHQVKKKSRRSSQKEQTDKISDLNQAADKIATFEMA